jgi:hypothetical protein
MADFAVLDRRNEMKKAGMNLGHMSNDEANCGSTETWRCERRDAGYRGGLSK